MFQQIIGNTPVWVWFVLAFLIYRGILASNDREMSLKAIFLLPVLMLGLSIQGIVGKFGAGMDVTMSWLAFAIVGGLLAAYSVKSASVAIDHARGTVWLRGSWGPLILMMCVFVTKYIVTVALVRNPSNVHDTLFVDSACALYGLFNGLFFGRPLWVAMIYKESVMAI